MTKKTGTKIKLLRGEKFMYVIIVFLMVLAPVLSVFTKAVLSESSIEVEHAKKQIESQTGINESLLMQINELASLDKIQEVAENLGLSYNDTNVKVIGNQ